MCSAASCALYDRWAPFPVPDDQHRAVCGAPGVVFEEGAAPCPEYEVLLRAQVNEKSEVQRYTTRATGVVVRCQVAAEVYGGSACVAIRYASIDIHGRCSGGRRSHQCCTDLAGGQGLDHPRDYPCTQVLTVPETTSHKEEVCLNVHPVKPLPLHASMPDDSPTLACYACTYVPGRMTWRAGMTVTRSTGAQSRCRSCSTRSS
jgi:hypothetical protein